MDKNEEFLYIQKKAAEMLRAARKQAKNLKNIAPGVYNLGRNSNGTPNSQTEEVEDQKGANQRREEESRKND